ncbi:hypothetical protein KJ652_05460 [Patescibacteria group bacterium]|nr:hypothetical protein [Patescibacteria group bacterium]MBU1124010.1 hypothetical protein [Patescibacteria group bacterium]
MPTYKRFFPGPQGIEAEVVVPMTDFSVIDPHKLKLPRVARDIIKERVGSLREELQRRGFAHGNKIASLLSLLHDESDDDTIPLMLHHGPSFLEHFRAVLKLPKTPAIREENPQTPEALFEIISNTHMGGNASNILRTELHMARSGIGARIHKVFAPSDKYLDPWMAQYLDEVGDLFEFHPLNEIESRYGAGFPYDDNGGREQRFSTNTPQASTIDAMLPHVGQLESCDFVVVSEGLGEILKAQQIEVSQLFNPTSALHVESAIEVLKRSNGGITRDGVFINDKEADVWLKVMENRIDGTSMDELPDAKFPSPFRKTKQSTAIDGNAIQIINDSHQRWLNVIQPPESEHMTCLTGVGCGPEGGQYQFQKRNRFYISCADTLTDKGAGTLINSLGRKERKVSTKTRDVVGAGDAAYAATILAMLHTPLEDLFKSKEPSLNTNQIIIAITAFHAILGRVFGELAFRSENRDLTGVPHTSFPRILDAVVNKSIAAAYKLTIVEKRPQRIYTDDEWGINFVMWELARKSQSSF